MASQLELIPVIHPSRPTNEPKSPGIEPSIPNIFVMLRTSSNNVVSFAGSVPDSVPQLFYEQARLHEKTEVFYITAIRNFLRKFNFNDLYSSLINEEISPEEFEAELDRHGEKYTVPLDDLKHEYDAWIIYYLVNKIGLDIRELSTSEVAEMFSVNENQLIKVLSK